MRAIATNRSILHFLEHLEASEAALAADPETAELAAPFAESIQDFEGVFRKERAARRDVVRSQAVLNVSDAGLDIDTTAFGGIAFVEAGQDRRSPEFRQYFPVAPSQLIRWNLRKQCEHTVLVLVPALSKVAKTSALKPFGAKLKSRAEAVLDAMDKRAKAKAALSHVGLEVEEWKEGVNRLRLSTYAELLKIAAEKKYPKSYAEAFFMAESRADTATSDESAEPSTPAAPTGAPTA